METTKMSGSRGQSQSRPRSVSPISVRSRSNSRSRSTSSSRSVSPVKRKKSKANPFPTLKSKTKLIAPMKLPKSLSKKSRAEAKAPKSDDDDGEVRKIRANDADFVSDFEVMLQKKKQERAKPRKRKDANEIINDNDELIAQLLDEMQMAAEDDRDLNKEGKPATKKIAMLSNAVSQLKKRDLQAAFLDNNVLTILTDWLAPMPDRSLPALMVREGILKLLIDFPAMDPYLLKQSGIGKAIMYLHKHPKETKQNKDVAGRLISNWSRPIFDLTTDVRAMSREEREVRDFEQMPKRRRLSEDFSASRPFGGTSVAVSSPQPGDPAWIPRARVPMSSNKDYVVRPKWISHVDISKESRKQASRLDKHIRTFTERSKFLKTERAIEISVEGRKMKL